MSHLESGVEQKNKIKLHACVCAHIFLYNSCTELAEYVTHTHTHTMKQGQISRGIIVLLIICIKYKFFCISI